ncbi:fibrinogen C domain-containing protein 1-like [Oppia nitens]|uniref:fibrinogen C domain-containing protein 1-like n=1 Tax=Oppia nitens TaxID=1686743 RepID=UPI0023DA147C|nr:fibrinogen C domain-containing protein 1-like [Oppia nitens]
MSIISVYIFIVFIIVYNAVNGIIDASNNRQLETNASAELLSKDSEELLLSEVIKKVVNQITVLDYNSQTQTKLLNEISRSLDRLESRRQDIITTIDRSEVRLSHRLDAIKSDLGKTITLQEVIRDDLDKLEKQQLVSKAWILDQLRGSVAKRNVVSEESETKNPLNIVSPDIEANLQVVQTTLNSLKRSNNHIEEQIGDLSNNMLTLINETTGIANRSKSYVESKSFNSGIRNVLEEMKKLEKPNVYIKNSLLDPNSSTNGSDFAKDCKDIQENENFKNLSGIYRIKPIGSDEPLFVFCDMNTDGGGWTLIHNRYDGTVDFYRDWYDYKYGFGNIASEFWLGLDHIHRITYQDIYELRIDLEDFEGDKAFAKYNAFAIGSQNENYMLKLLGSYEGDAGDSMTYHVSMPFTTKDNDNDPMIGSNCAIEHTGAWWYNQCETANLNGLYLSGMYSKIYTGMYWQDWQGSSYSLKRTNIKIRPIHH